MDKFAAVRAVHVDDLAPSRTSDRLGLKTGCLPAGIGGATAMTVGVAASLASEAAGISLSSGMAGPDLNTVPKNMACYVAMDALASGLGDATSTDLAKLDLSLTECALGGLSDG